MEGLMTAYSSEGSTREDRRTDRRITKVRRRRMKRRLAQFSVAGIALYSVSHLADARREALASAGAETHSLDIPPLWRPAAAVLDRPVAEGPWRVRTASLDGISESTDDLLRWNAIFTYARQYRITMDLARQIHDIAIEEKIDPDLAFRLVRLESRFDPDVVSHAGAIGLTQLMPGTARYFQPGVTEEQLTDPETNLRIGFRYLRGLVKEYRGDLKLALLVYNRGPTAVMNALAMGEDPANGYDRLLMRGYSGSGVID
jgi:soluble lytic murein transglycosylase-like protein